MVKIYQDKKYTIIQDKKTVDWLVNNSYVYEFDPIKFVGYQREIEENHCKKMIKYIEENNFFFPTSIICACDDPYDKNLKLRIVDGQHRIHAFRMLKNSETYQAIADKEIPIIVLEKIELPDEIKTFININKKGKKVDTSLATVLNHSIVDKDDINKKRAKIEYISVEVARELSVEKEGIWENQICFEGNAKKHNQLISINAFVRSTNFLLLALTDANIISINWANKDELNKIKQDALEIIRSIWDCVVKKWPELFNKTIGMNSVIQGPIGYSSINKFIVFYLKENPITSKDVFLSNIRIWFDKISRKYDKWISDDKIIGYSSYSSEAGYTIIAKDLIESMRE